MSNQAKRLTCIADDASHGDVVATSTLQLAIASTPFFSGVVRRCTSDDIAVDKRAYVHMTMRSAQRWPPDASHAQGGADCWWLRAACMHVQVQVARELWLPSTSGDMLDDVTGNVRIHMYTGVWDQSQHTLTNCETSAGREAIEMTMVNQGHGSRQWGSCVRVGSRVPSNPHARAFC